MSQSNKPVVTKIASVVFGVALTACTSSGSPTTDDAAAAPDATPDNSALVEIVLEGASTQPAVRARVEVMGPGMSAIGADLIKTDDGFSGSVQVPHGIERSFTVNAFDSMQMPRWTGTTSGVMVPANEPVVVVMRDTGTNPEEPPVISSLTASTMRVEPGQPVQLTLGVEPTDDVLSFAWSASSGIADDPDANVFSPSGADENPVWHAPLFLQQPGVPTTYTLRVVVTNEANLSASAQVEIEVIPMTELNPEAPGAPVVTVAPEDDLFRLSIQPAVPVVDAVYSVYAAISPAHCDSLRQLRDRFWAPRFLLQSSDTAPTILRSAMTVPVCYAVSVTTREGGEGRLSEVVEIPAATTVAPAQDETEQLIRGLRWLVAAETTPGRWGAPDDRTTAEVVFALARAQAAANNNAPQEPAPLAAWEQAERTEVVRRGLLSLLQTQADDNYTLAMQLLALHESGQWPIRLWKHYLASGHQFLGHIWGWGAHAHVLPDPMRTALGLRLLKHFPLEPDMADGTRSVLEHDTLKSASGRYSWVPHSGVDDVTVSAFVYTEIDAAPETIDWIRQRQDAQGAYGTLSDTIGVLRSGLALNTATRPSARQDARTFVFSSQGVRGDWAGHLVQTAQALRGLLPQSTGGGTYADRPRLTGWRAHFAPDVSDKTVPTFPVAPEDPPGLLDTPSLDTDGDGQTDLQEWLGDKQGDPAFATLAPSPDVPFHPELAALAERLQYDPVHLYDFVYHEIEFEDYEGARKGALATYRSRRGNAWDQSTLLITLLRMSGVPARFVMGESIVAKIRAPGAFYTGEHVAVEAWANPLRHVTTPRSAFEAPDKAWLPLLPWYKDRRVVQEGIALFPGTPEGDIILPSELDTRDSYLAPPVDDDDAFHRHTQKTSVEFFEDTLQSYLDTHQPGASTEDVPHVTTIIRTPVTVLPSTYPAGVEFFDFNIQAAHAVTEIPIGNRVRVGIRLEARDLVAPGNTRVLLETAFELARVAGKRIVIDSREETLNGAPAYRPVVLVDGQVHLESQEPPMVATDRLIVSYRRPGPDEPWVPRPTLAAGSFAYLQLDSLQASDAALLAHRAALLTAPSDTALSPDPTVREQYLGNMAGLIATTHGLRTMQAIRRADQLFQATHTFRPWHLQWTMIWTDPRAVAVGADAGDAADGPAYGPFRFHPAFGFDNINDVGSIYKSNFAQQTSSEPPWQGFPFLANGNTFTPIWQRIAHDGSSLAEGRVFEDVLGTPGYSTIGALFLAHQQGVEVARLTSDMVADAAGEAAVRARLSALEGWTVDDIVNALKQPEALVITPVTPVARVASVHETGPQDTHGYILSHRHATGYQTSWLYDKFNGGDGTGQLVGSGVTTIIVAEPGNYLTVRTLGESSIVVEETPIQNGPASNTVGADGVPAGDPVDLVTGEFYTEERPDIQAATRGELEFAVRRSYRSQAIYDGPFGFGWTWNHSESIVAKTDGTLQYFDAERWPHQLVPLAGGTYRYPKGTTFRLAKDGGDYVVFKRNGHTIRFHADGTLKEKTDRNGNQLRFVYDAAGQLAQILDATDRALTLEYNDDGKVHTVRDFGGREVHYDYVDKDLVAFTDLAGNTTRFEVLTNQDKLPLNNHNLVRYTLPSGDYLEIAYLDNDRVAWHENAYGHRFEFHYSQINGYAETWDEDGRYQKIFFDEDHNVIRWQKRDGSIERREYDDEHNMTARIDGDGYRTEFTYSNDGRRNLESETNALGETTRYTHAHIGPAQSVVTSVTDPRGYVTRHSYDDLGNRIQTIQDLTLANASTAMPAIHFDPKRVIAHHDVVAKRVEETTYDAYGNRINVHTTVQALVDDDLVDIADITERDTTTETYEYEPPYVNVSRSIDTQGRATSFGYDDWGRMISTQDAEGTMTRFERHAFGEPMRVSVDNVGEIERAVFDENGRMAKRTDARGGETTFVYRTARDIVHHADLDHTIDPLGFITALSYDAVGNVIRRTDKNGHATTLRYDAQNRLTERTNALGETEHFAYNARGLVTRHRDPTGHATLSKYDGAGRLVRVDSPESQTTIYGYNAAGHRTLEIDPLGVQTRSTYDVDGRRIEYVQGANLTTPRISRTIYDGLGRMLYEIDARGTEHHYTRNRRGQLVAERWVKTDGLVVRSVSYEYDELGRVVAQTDGRGTTTETGYDALGRIAWTAVPDPNQPGDETARLETVNEWTRAGDLKHTIDPMGHTTRYEYDLLGQRVVEIAPDGGIQSFGYDGNGNQIRRADARGNSTRVVFDAANRPIAVVRPTGATEYLEYDAAGRHTVISEHGAAGHAHRQRSYDGLGRVVRQVDALGHVTTTTWADDASTHTRQRTIESPTGAVTRSTFDGFGDLVVEEVSGTDIATSTTEFTYAPGNLLTSLITHNAAGVVVWRYGLDALGRRTWSADTDGTIHWNAYDAEGAPTLETLRDGTTVRRHYDALGRLIEVVVNDVTEQIFAYDGASRLVRAEDRNQGIRTHTTVLTVDAMSRPRLERQDDHLVSRAFDRTGNVTELVYPSGNRLQAEYDSRNLPRSYRFASRDRIVYPYEFDYDNTRRLSAFRLGHHIRGRVEYNLRGFETKRRVDTQSAQPVYYSDLTWSEVSLTHERRTTDVLTQVNYGHDVLGRVLTYDINADDQIDRSWQYDALGNWIATTHSGATFTTQVNGDNEYVSFADAAVLYDAHGNIAETDGRRFHYDWKHRLVEVLDADTEQSIARYTYDAFDRRMTKSVSGEPIAYVYDGHHVIEEHAANGVRSFAYGPELDHAVVMEAPDHRAYYYVRNHRNSVVALVTSDGAIAERNSYSPFGSLQDEASLSTHGNPLGFTGRRWDAESGLWHYRARAYSDHLGRFLQRDPLGTIDGINMYAYVGNNPLRFTDPLGLSARDNPIISFPNGEQTFAGEIIAGGDSSETPFRGAGTQFRITETGHTIIEFRGRDGATHSLTIDQTPDTYDGPVPNHINTKPPRWLPYGGIIDLEP